MVRSILQALLSFGVRDSVAEMSRNFQNENAVNDEEDDELRSEMSNLSFGDDDDDHHEEEQDHALHEESGSIATGSIAARDLPLGFGLGGGLLGGGGYSNMHRRSVHQRGPPTSIVGSSTSTRQDNVPDPLLPSPATSRSSSARNKKVALEGNEEYQSFIDKLTDADVDTFLDLPMIAVMGDTSSGKSSLLTMISEVELPSSAQLTTRCPIKLQMSYAAKKRAQVEIVWKSPIDVDSSTGRHPQLLQHENQFDDSNWEQLTEAISRAQQHILDLTGKDVAPDVVSVKLQGPSCVNLTLIDLPGIVRTTGLRESDTLSQDIQSLMEEYLQNPKCVILAVLPANVDFHNSQIMAEAEKVDPHRRRTIPVLTKPDLIDEGAEAGVRDLLLGLKTEAFQKGFHMVKGRGQAALNRQESITAALQSEEIFFDTTRPWSNVDDRSLFGTKRLRLKLSIILIDLIRDSFPAIIAEMQEQQQSTRDQLSRIGDIPDSLTKKRTCFEQIKESFLKSTKAALNGSPMDGSMNFESQEQNCAAEFHDICDEYKSELHNSSFYSINDIFLNVPVVAIDRNGMSHKGEVVHMDDHYVYLNGKYEEGVRVEQSFGQIGNVKQIHGRVFQQLNSKQAYQLIGFRKEFVQRDTEWIMHMLRRYRTLSLPIFVNSALFEKIVADSIDSQWKDPSLEVVNDLSRTITTSITGLVDSDTSLQRFPRLGRFVLRVCKKVISEAAANAKTKVEHFVDAEKKPYTQDRYIFENLSRNRNKFVLERIKSSMCRENGTISTTEALHIVEAAFQADERKSVDEQIAADIMYLLDGYGKLAAKRFIDSIPMICADGLLHGLEAKLKNSLASVSDKDIDQFMSIPDEEIVRRHRLEKKLEILETGILVVEELF